MATGFSKKLDPPHEFPFVVQKNFIRASVTPSLDLSGCVCWLDAQDIFGNGSSPADGASITSWSDKSGNGVEVVSYPIASETVVSEVIPPVYTLRKRGVFFNGTNASLKTTLSASESIETFFIVCEVSELLNVNGTPRNNILLGSQERGRTLYVTDDIYYITGGTSSNGTTANAAFSTFPNDIQRPIVVGTTKDTQRIRNYVNGTLLQHYDITGFYEDGSPAFSYGPNCTTSISGYITGDGISRTITSAGGFYGYVYEILVYHEVINTQRRQRIEAYLSKKWNCTQNFENTHPIKNQLNLESTLQYQRATQVLFVKV
jgi:hypothetical protein